MDHGEGNNGNGNNSSGIQVNKFIYDSRQADAVARLPGMLFDRRFWQLLGVLIRFWFACVIDVLNPQRGATEQQIKRFRAIRIRQLLVDLGPTFIKIGQFLSVRRDILPIEVAEELALLYDRVPPFDISLVRQTIEADLGKPPEELFSTFIAEPLASASIGQVHLVELLDGRPAVIKVQRPDLHHMFLRDLGYLRLWAKLLKFTGKKRSESWLELSDEFGRTLFAETDYLQEGRSADRLRRMLRNQLRIRIPRVYWKHTGRRVLTMEFLPGIKIDQVEQLELAGFDLRDLATLLIEGYMVQILYHGYFHADPHPGNLAIDLDGSLIIYDFGMMGEISSFQRGALARCVTSVTRGDPEGLTQALIDIGVVKADARRAPVTRTVKPFIDYYRGRDIMSLDFEHLEQDIDKLILDQALRLPPSLAYLLRAGSSLEGIARTLKPNFSFVAAARPVLRRWTMDQTSFLGSLLLGEIRNSNGNNDGRYPEIVRLSEDDGVRAVELQHSQARLEKAMRLVFLSLFLVSMAMLFLGTTITPEYHSLSRYILIGNGLLGAIIILVAFIPARRP